MRLLSCIIPQKYLNAEAHSSVILRRKFEVLRTMNLEDYKVQKRRNTSYNPRVQFELEEAFPETQVETIQILSYNNKVQTKKIIFKGQKSALICKYCDVRRPTL